MSLLSLASPINQSQDSASGAALSIDIGAPSVGNLLVTSLSVFISGAAAGNDIAIQLIEDPAGANRLMWKGWIGSGSAKGSAVMPDWESSPLMTAKAGTSVRLSVGAGGTGCVITGNIAAKVEG